jgi:hypothetical protein
MGIILIGRRPDTTEGYCHSREDSTSNSDSTAEEEIRHRAQECMEAIVRRDADYTLTGGGADL